MQSFLGKIADLINRLKMSIWFATYLCQYNVNCILTFGITSWQVITYQTKSQGLSGLASTTQRLVKSRQAYCNSASFLWRIT